MSKEKKCKKKLAGGRGGEIKKLEKKIQTLKQMNSLSGHKLQKKKNMANDILNRNKKNLC